MTPEDEAIKLLVLKHFKFNFTLENNPDFGDKGMQMLADLIAKNLRENNIRYIENISLINCNITDTGVQILCDTLLHLGKEEGIYFEIMSISLQGNPITTEGVEYIMTLLVKDKIHYEGLYYRIFNIDLCDIQTSELDNDRYDTIFYNYLIQKAKDTNREEDLYTEFGHHIKAKIMETITPKFIFTGIYYQWDYLELYP
jgi:hypothetical protein